ncbi:MAG: cupin domain-containing protein [Mycobacteriales bacterium]
MANGAYVLAPGEGRRLDMGPFGMVIKANAEDSAGGLTLLEADEPAGFGPPMHIHDDAAEAFYVLEGEYIVYIEGAEHRCLAGSFVYVPAGVEHGFRVGAGAGRKLNIYVPSAMEGYFGSLAAATAEGTTLSAADLTVLAARHAMRVTGPVPEGYV